LLKIPASHQDLLADQTRAIAFLATLMPDGSPQVTPVWFNTDGKFIYINTAEGRVKDRNKNADPRVAILIQHPKDPFHYLQVRGRVVEITKDGADEQIDTLAGKYTGIHGFRERTPGEVRVKYKISVEHIYPAK
jgi:PPOX class probable F420-dependent enzyme